MDATAPTKAAVQPTEQAPSDRRVGASSSIDAPLPIDAPVPLDLTLDERADAFAWLAGEHGALFDVLEATRSARSSGRPVRWRVKLSAWSVHRLEGLFSLAHDEGAEPVLLPPDAPLSVNDRLFALDFLRTRLLEEDAYRVSPDRLDEYASLVRRLEGGDARIEAVSAPEDVRLRPAAEGQEPLSDVLSVLADGLRGLGRWLAAGLPGWVRGRVGLPDRLPAVLMVGAYGGDHIGDTAILGGVLLRLHERFGTRRVLLLSQRPDHTRHLVEMLDVPMDVDVDVYEHDVIRRGLAEADGLVHAGGPLTDIPKQLVRHLYAASLARSAGKPYLMEGIGVGPFQRRPSEWVARRLLSMADHVAVRTASDGEKPQVRHRRPVVGRDPAFDYLDSRRAELTRLADGERAAIDALLADTAGRPVVAINTRPIYDLFTEGTPEGVDRARHTRTIEDRFEMHLADGLRGFAERAPARPCFVFYPMNAVQFGKSDLRSAWRIARRLGADVDFRVWQADASIDAVIALLRRVDAVIAMRFHAAIYALSQRRPLIGVDYRPGVKDKVGYLMSDFGMFERCRRIDELDAEWLAGQLAVLTADPGARA